MTPTDAPTAPMTPKAFLMQHRKWITIGAGALVALLLIVICFGWYNSVRNGLIDRETTLNAQYQANQAELDAFVKKVTEEFSVSNVKSAQLDKVLSDAVRGRYDNELSTAQPGKGQLFSAISEAYPDLSGLDVYDRLVTEISAGRENFKQVQNKLLDQLREYEAWRSKGILHSRWASFAGYPKLEARIGTKTFTGKAALEQMHLIVTSERTDQNFQTGKEEPLNLTTPGT